MILREPREQFGALVVGLYAWLTAVSFGAVLLDFLYARLAPGAEAALGEAADFLLLVDAVTLLAALGAIGLAWRSRAARSLVLASLIVAAAGFLAPALLAPLLRDAGPGSGASLRIAISGLASLLAGAGSYRYFRPA
jgi:hypothetical protein